MARINVYRYDGPDYDQERVLDGWFDPDRCERFDQGEEWDGNNSIGVITGSEWIDEYLYRTKGGRWVLNRDAHRCNNGPDDYQFLTAEQAHDWLLRSQINDDAIGRYFGEVEEERGPGRPEIGPAINVRLGELLDRVDQYAEQESIKRAEAVRRLVAAGLDS